MKSSFTLPIDGFLSARQAICGSVAMWFCGVSQLVDLDIDIYLGKLDV